MCFTWNSVSRLSNILFARADVRGTDRELRVALVHQRENEFQQCRARGGVKPELGPKRAALSGDWVQRNLGMPDEVLSSRKVAIRSMRGCSDAADMPS